MDKQQRSLIGQGWDELLVAFAELHPGTEIRVAFHRILGPEKLTYYGGVRISEATRASITLPDLRQTILRTDIDDPINFWVSTPYSFSEEALQEVPAKKPTSKKRAKKSNQVA